MAGDNQSPRAGSGRGRRYHVSGIDDLGDVHTFSTDDRVRADEIRAIMQDDLEQVELRDITA